MDDIVDRLRAGKVLLRFEDGSYISDGPSKTRMEAADEIERLRADNELLKQIAANVSAQGASLEDVEMWLANARAAAIK